MPQRRRIYGSPALVDTMARDLNCSVADLMRSRELRGKIDLERYVSETVGLPTLKDIAEELAKPGRDPGKRSKRSASSSRRGRETRDEIAGVTNITAFGAFIDIGVHQDGLAHISQLSDKYIKDPNGRSMCIKRSWRPCSQSTCSGRGYPCR